MRFGEGQLARPPGTRITRIATPTDAAVIEVVRGRLDRARSQELLRFWFARRALSSPEAQRRLPEVVSLLRHAGRLVGANSVYQAEIPLIGGRRFWIYRSLIDDRFGDEGPAMIRSAFDAVQAEFDGSPGSPVGLCVLAGPAERRRRPEAEWSNPRMIYAGYLPDGLQVRIAYFQDAVIA